MRTTCVDVEVTTVEAESIRLRYRGSQVWVCYATSGDCFLRGALQAVTDARAWYRRAEDDHRTDDERRTEVGKTPFIVMLRDEHGDDCCSCDSTRSYVVFAESTTEAAERVRARRAALGSSLPPEYFVLGLKDDGRLVELSNRATVEGNARDACALWNMFEHVGAAKVTLT